MEDKQVKDGQEEASREECQDSCDRENQDVTVRVTREEALLDDEAQIAPMGINLDCQAV